MRRHAVHPVKSQVLVELWQTQESLQRRLAHLQDIAEPHVIFHQCDDLLRVLIRKTEPSENCFGHPYANVDMPIESNAVARLFRIRRTKRRGLANVMQQRAPCESCQNTGFQL